MTDYLFDTPYWLLALFAVVGVGLLVSANARQEKRLARAGVAVLTLGALLLLLSYFVKTDKEKVLTQTQQIVKAVENQDTATLDRLLHPGAILEGPGLTKAQILAMAPAKVEQYKITNIKFSPEPPRQLSAGVIEVSGTITADAQGMGLAGNAPTDWQFSWVKTPDGWRLRQIRPLKFSIGNVDLQSLISTRMR